MWKAGDPYTDGSYAREAGSSKVFWDAIHEAYNGTEIEKEIYEWWRDKPHQVAAEICEGWRQAEARIAALEASLRTCTEERDAEIKRARTAEAENERLRKSLHDHTNDYIEAAHDLAIRAESAESALAAARRESAAWKSEIDKARARLHMAKRVGGTRTSIRRVDFALEWLDSIERAALRGEEEG